MHNREATRSAAIDTLHFKLHKPISRHESSKKIKKNNKKHWWKNALLWNDCLGLTAKVNFLIFPVWRSPLSHELHGACAVSERFDGNSEWVAEFVMPNGFKAAYAIKGGANRRTIAFFGYFQRKHLVLI